MCYHKSIGDPQHSQGSGVLFVMALQPPAAWVWDSRQGGLVQSWWVVPAPTSLTAGGEADDHWHEWQGWTERTASKLGTVTLLQFAPTGELGCSSLIRRAQ